MSEILPPPVNVASHEELVGYLAFVLRWSGSKSERFFPCLLGWDGSVRWIKHSKDSSYDHNHLNAFHLRAVRVRLRARVESAGHWVVDSVEEVSDPWKGPANSSASSEIGAA